MDEIEVRPLEKSGAIEGSEGVAAQKLDDATFEPRAYTEQIGDYRQAEAIQSNFTAVIEQVRDCPIPIPHTGSELTGGIEQVGTLPTPLPRTAEEAGASHVPLTPDTSRPEAAGAEERDTVRGQQPQVSDGFFQPAPAGSGGDQENITPINLPNVRNEGLASGAQGKVSVASVEGGNAETIEEVNANQIVDSLDLRLQMGIGGNSQIESMVANIVKVYNNDNTDIMGM